MFMRRPRQSCGARQRCSDSTGKGVEMQFSPGVVEAIGNTPLIKLKRASAETGCTILGQGRVHESRAVGEGPPRATDHPGGGEARRDQAGRARGRGTAGNTGIGLALVANARGYRTLIVIPETQSREKKDMLRLCGAELVEVPAVAYANPNNYQHIGRRLANELRKSEPNGVLFADQWNNLDNRKAHYVSTGPGDLGADRRQGGRLHMRHRHRRHHCRRVGLSAGEEEGHHDRRCRSEGRGHVQPVCPRRGQGVGRRLHHRRDRAWTRDRRSSRTSRSTSPI